MSFRKCRVTGKVNPGMWLRYRILRPFGLGLSKMSIYRLKWSGSGSAPVSGPFIIVSNHQTSVDAFAIGIALKKVCLLYTSDAADE